MLCSNVFGQANHKNTVIPQQVKKVNALLKKYSKLSPFSANEDRFDIIDAIRGEITSRMIKILNYPDIYMYRIENLFSHDELVVSKSEDNKIYFFSIDQKTGGSFRTYETIILYKLANGKPKAAFFLENSDDILANSTYGKFYELDAKAQKYFVIANVQTCNTCIVSSAVVLQISKDVVKNQLVVQFDGRYDNLTTFDYDPKLKELTYEYQSTNEGENKARSYHAKYRYQNGVFSKVKNSQKPKKGK